MIAKTHDHLLEALRCPVPERVSGEVLITQITSIAGQNKYISYRL